MQPFPRLALEVGVTKELVAEVVGVLRIEVRRMKTSLAVELMDQAFHTFTCARDQAQMACYICSITSPGGGIRPRL